MPEEPSGDTPPEGYGSEHIPYIPSQPQTPPAGQTSSSQEQSEPQGRPPPGPPVPLPLTPQQQRKQYFLGLACGLIPVILFLLGYGIWLGTLGNSLIVLVWLGLFLYIVELIVTIVFLNIKKLRFAGYGLLTAFLVTPIVTAIGCTVLPSLIHSS